MPEVVELLISKPRTLIKPINQNYYFYWRTAGGKAGRIIVPVNEVQKYIEHYGKEYVTIQQLPKGLKFLEHIKQYYIGLDTTQ